MSRNYDNSLNDYQRQINQVTDDSLDSTRRMRNLLYESKETGTTTIIMLDEQGEKLKRIDENLDLMNQNLKDVEKDLTQMEKCCGLCLCPFSKRPKGFEKTIDNKNEKKKTNQKEVIVKQPQNIQTNKSPGGQQARGPYIERITNDAREDEMEDNLAEVGDLVGELRLMASDMGTELDKQNLLITDITDKAGGVGFRIDVADKRTKVILGQK